MEDGFDDFDFNELSHAEGFAVFDEYYGNSPGEPPPVEVDYNEPLTAPSPILEPDLVPPVDDDEFAGLMGDLEQLPDAPLPNDVPPDTAPLEDPFTGAHPPETPNFLAPGPLANSIFQDPPPPYSPELPQGDMAGILQVQPSPEAPSSANKSLMQDEMRHEEDLSTSPLPLNDRPLSRLSLRNSISTSGAQNARIGTVEDTMHVDGDGTPQANPEDDLPSTKSWNFDSLSPTKNSNDSEQQAEDAPTVSLRSTGRTERPVLGTEPRSKRRRKTSSPDVLIPSLEEIRAKDANSQEPPAKKHRAGTPKTKSPDLEVQHPKSGALTGLLSHAEQSKDPQLIGADEEGDSSLTDIASENLPSPPVTSNPVPSNKMATPEARADAKAHEETATQDGTMTLAGEGSTFEDAIPEGLPDESPKWNFDALKEGSPVRANSDTSSPKKKPTKGKGKGRAKAKAGDGVSTAPKRGKSAGNESAANTPPAKRSRVGKQELDDLIGSTVLKGVRKMDASPRKTRKERKDEEDAKPNAAGAAKRRQSGGGTKRK